MFFSNIKVYLKSKNCYYELSIRNNINIALKAVAAGVEFYNNIYSIDDFLNPNF